MRVAVLKNYTVDVFLLYALLHWDFEKLGIRRSSYRVTLQQNGEKDMIFSMCQIIRMETMRNWEWHQESNAKGFRLSWQYHDEKTITSMTKEKQEDWALKVSTFLSEQAITGRQPTGGTYYCFQGNMRSDNYITGLTYLCSNC